MQRRDECPGSNDNGHYPVFWSMTNDVQPKGLLAMTSRFRILARAMLIMLVGAGVFAPQALAQDATTESPAFDPSTFNVGLAPVGEEFDQPLFVTNAGDDSGRLFVVERPGIVRIIADGNVVETPFLDISDRVGTDGSERGLLGLAFAPDYAESRLFYVDYTDLNGNTVVSRFAVTDDPDVADPSSESVLLQQEQPYENHNGGELLFGPDGYLYIGFGDGGSQGDPHGNGQNLGVWLGKILRIDVDPANTPEGEPYAVPDDNPFVGQADAKPEIFVYGLRNPWRFSFDTATGDLYIGDVGQDTYEEIDFVSADEVGGQDFGWNIMEATHCYRADTCDESGLTLPVFEYAHDVGGCSVTGGYVYRGTEIPELDGTYLFADYCSGKLWGMGRDANGEWVASDPIETGAAVSSFGQDESGELYLTDINGGVVYQIVAGS